MNPLDFMGPQFLVFYLVFGLLVLAAARVVRRALESGPVPAFAVSDPYVIATLRSGPAEAARLAVLQLSERQALSAGLDGRLGAALDPSPGVNAIENAVLAAADKGAQWAEALAREPRVLSAAEDVVDDLQRRRLLATTGTYFRRLLLTAVTVAVLWGVAGTKIAVALARGRTNVELLIVLAALFALAAGVVLLAGRRTALGDAVLADVRALCEPLYQRKDALGTSGVGAAEGALLFAAFGVAALPAALAAQSAFAAGPGRSNFFSGTGSDSGFTGSGDSGSSSSDGGSSCGGGGGCGGCGGGGGGD